MRYSSGSVWMLYLNRRWFCDVFGSFIVLWVQSLIELTIDINQGVYLKFLVIKCYLSFTIFLINIVMTPSIFLNDISLIHRVSRILAWWILRDTIATWFDRLKNHLILHRKSRELFRIAIKIPVSLPQFCDLTWSTQNRVALPGCFTPVESCSLHFVINRGG